MSQPSLETRRLTLRPFCLSDAADIQALAGDRSIADMTLNIPHPYEDGIAQQWIERHQPGYEEGSLATFAVDLRPKIRLIGAIGLRIDVKNNRGELGYWVGKPYWNLGYATEATNAVLAFGFDHLKLNRIHAVHLARNPASGRVMEKAGMLLEGMLRQDVMKLGKYEDLAAYGILKEDWLQR